MADYSWFHHIKTRMSLIAKTKKAIGLMMMICFIEPIFLPMIPELILTPIILAQKDRALKIIVLALVANTLGAIFAYSTAYFAGQILLTYSGEFILSLYAQGKTHLLHYGFFLPFLGSFTPFPLKVITWTCGLTRFHFFYFISGVAGGRTLRYALNLIFLRNKNNIDRDYTQPLESQKKQITETLL